MNRSKCLLLPLLLFLISANIVHAQSTIETRTGKDISLYGNLYHQHHDFFHKAFSFQGLETGILLHRRLFLGVYGSAFASNLHVNILQRPTNVWIGQGGITTGMIWNAERRFHPGCQLNLGYFGLRADEADFGLFHTANTDIKINGLVAAPQLFVEWNALTWLKIRTGLAYNFYGFENHSVVKPSDLQNISFTFGFIFGRYN